MAPEVEIPHPFVGGGVEHRSVAGNLGSEHLAELIPLDVPVWVRTAIEAMQADLRSVAKTVAHHSAVLDEMARSKADPARVVELAEALPQRIVDALAAVSGAGTVVMPVDVERLVAELSVAMKYLDHTASELRNETQRLRAFREALHDDLPTVARAVDEATARADARLAEVADHLDELTALEGPDGVDHDQQSASN
jgi:phage shock protein A